MVHIALHFIVPVVIALAFYRDNWRKAALIMVATMVVDADHLLANPIYDPDRCSIGFHPLHSVPMIALYLAVFLLPLVLGRKADGRGLKPAAWVLHLVGLGLLLHMALDWLDCIN
jgi:hypothetical protein